MFIAIICKISVMWELVISLIGSGDRLTSLGMPCANCYLFSLLIILL